MNTPRRNQCEAGVTPCGAPARLYPGGRRCDLHKPTRSDGLINPDANKARRTS